MMTAIKNCVVTSPEESMAFQEVEKKIQHFLGEDLLELNRHERPGGSENRVLATDLWIEIPPGRFMDLAEFLGTMDFPHFHVISGKDEGEKILLTYHLSLFRAGGVQTRVGISVKVRLPKEELSMLSLWPIIPGVEYSEREVAELYGVDFVGLENKNLVFLPEDWDRSVFPKRQDETGLKPEDIRQLS